MSNGRQYGGWIVMRKVFGRIGVRYKRSLGRADKMAGFTQDGRQITEFAHGLIEKAELLPWAKEEIERQTGIKWVSAPGGAERPLQNLESAQ